MRKEMKKLNLKKCFDKSEEYEKKPPHSAGGFWKNSLCVR